MHYKMTFFTQKSSQHLGWCIYKIDPLFRSLVLTKDCDNFVQEDFDVNAVLGKGGDLSLEDRVSPQSGEDSIPLFALQVGDGSAELLIISHLLVEKS